jgi:hypothetical protein
MAAIIGVKGGELWSIEEGGVKGGRPLQLHGAEEGGRPWRGGGARGGGGAAGSLREGERGRGTWPGGPARPAWLLKAKKAGWAGWPLGRLG